MSHESHQHVLTFWFEECKPEQWFSKDSDFDALVKKRFLGLLNQAKNCELFAWRSTPQGRLAEVIVLDQFSRNIFRDQPESFAQDPLALSLAQAAVEGKHDKNLSLQERAFLYMPYMHSESPRIHQIAVELFSLPGLENNLNFEHKHKEIIDRYGRYPHRNTILGRESTPDEVEFLKKPGSSF